LARLHLWAQAQRRGLSRRAGLQSERMQHSAHLPLECLVDQLMLLHARLALERWRDDRRGIVVAVAREIPDRDLRIGDMRLDQTLDFDGIHGHRQVLANITALRPCKPEAMIQTVPAES